MSSRLPRYRTGAITMQDITRRTLLSGMAAGLAATSGCLEALTGSGPLTFSSAPARVEEAVLEETGYRLSNTESPTVSREFTVAGQTRSVEVTNHVALYEKSVDLGPMGEQRAGVFGVFTTPQVDIVGQTLNPIAELSDRDLLQRFLSRFEGLSVGDQQGSETVSTLGKSVTVDRYDGTATFQGQKLDIFVHLARFNHGEDIVVAVGGYPKQLPGGGEDILAMVGGLTH
ncbi:MAG: DUF6517 family protein [Halodesulfurarchaeum sp.]